MRHARKDLGSSVDVYTAALEGPVREIADALVALVREAVPDAKGELKWGMPVFSRNGAICYVRAYAGYVRFGFTEHIDALVDPEGRLEGSGAGRHVKFTRAAQIDRAQLTTWIRAVAEA